ncbi:MAG TPA: adenylate/guanylate cyclase domain-containing protein [Nitrososphaerales archaeon]|nr:adenylate/guanylate cyclase domain-containing protein [Nitrososphaerales archaeon]
MSGDRVQSAPGGGQRKLAAIMFADIEGYTAMTQRNEARALEILDEYRRLLRSALPKEGGTEIKTIGDGMLFEFDSALEATRCAVRIQELLHERNRSMPADRLLLARVGIHLGDVVHSGGDAYGDAVNIASRIEPLAPAGGVCISEQVYDQVRNKAEFPFRSLGRRQLKNVELPVEVYSVVLPWEAASPTQPPEARDRRRIAVLPFTNISSDPKDEYFAEGLTEELIANLSLIAGLRVIARTSMMKFKGANKGIGEIAGELNVGTVLEGSVRKAGTKLRVTTQLIDASTEEHLWSNTYDKELEDVFVIQSDIAQKVAEALKVRLLSSEIEGMDGRATKNVEAYSLYLKGRHHWNRRSESGVTSAVAFFEQAIREDPGYALAYAGLADCYSIMGYYAYRPPYSVYPQARELIMKALDLDNTLAEAHASLGEVLMHYYWDWPGAESSLKKSISMKPSYPTARLWYATFLQVTGHLEQAILEEKKGLELDPLSLIANADLARAYYFLRRYSDSVEQYRKTLEIDPTFAIAYKGLAEVHAATGEYDTAMSELGKALEFSGGSLFIKDDIGYVNALAGRPDEARRTIEELKAASTTRYVPPYGIAMIYFALREDDNGFLWLEKSYQEKSFMTFLGVDPALDRLRGDPRLVSLVERLGFSR